MRCRNASGWIALIYVLIGGLIGSLLGHLLAPVWPPLGHSYFQLGTSTGPWTLNLGVFGLDLGIWLDVNLGGMIGLVGGLWWFRRRKA